MHLRPPLRRVGVLWLPILSLQTSALPFLSCLPSLSTPALFLLLLLSYTFPMPNAYLLKTEPSEYSFRDLQKDKKTVWDGVHNPVALRNLGEMKPGDHLIVYETGDEKAVVGTASVVSVKVTDPKNPQVEVAADKALAKPITLAEIKANKIFATSPLVRMGRLSVVPLTPEQYKFLASS
jgi:predicted RNA-binding protein with PUA-like domain